MLRVLLALVVALVIASSALAQEKFTPGSDDTLNWVEPDKGLDQMLEEIKPGILYFYSAFQVEFCKTVEKDIIPQKSLKPGWGGGDDERKA
jgi:hypothetical protein